MAASAVRLVAFVVPVAVSLGATATLNWVLPVPDTSGQRTAWWFLLLAVAIVALLLSDRAARRLLPLATLLRLSLAFPDRAPSRLRAALRTGTVRQLERRVQDVRRRGLGDGPGDAARTVVELAAALNTHDRRTRGHSERVRAFTDLVAAEMRLDEGDRDRLRWAALLHDIGKLFVPGEVLNREGGLSEDDWVRIRAHPSAGERVIEPLAPWLGEWAAVVGQHHEWWDGSGYPQGLAGHEITVGARVVAVADAYEVMTALRSYKRPIRPDAARAELVRQAGSQFDPRVVRAMLAVSIGRLQLATGLLGWLAHLPFAARIPTTPLASTAAATVVAAGTVLGVGAVDLPGLADRPAAEVLGVTVSNDPAGAAATTDVPASPTVSTAGPSARGASARARSAGHDGATPSGVTPASPAAPATRADPGDPGGGATPAVPATPATPASPAHEGTPPGQADDDGEKEPKEK